MQSRGLLMRGLGHAECLHTAMNVRRLLGDRRCTTCQNARVACSGMHVRRSKLSGCMLLSAELHRRTVDLEPD